MKYLKEFQSLAILNQWYHNKNYGEPNILSINDEPDNPNKKPILEKNNGKYWVIEYDTTKSMTDSACNTLWTTYNNNTSNSHPDEVYIDGVKYNERDGNGYLIPPLISSLSNGKHIVKMKFSSITTTGGAPVFYNNAIVKAHIPECVESLGSNTFNMCRNLEYVNIPPKVTSLNSSSLFYNCTGLKEFTVPEQVTEFGSGMFGGLNIETLNIYCKSINVFCKSI